ncbi:Bcr/CflA family drug resistance efflux transporter [Methylobacterium oxalidis]|uniref:Bcr/CflA family efflux transporter n=1 Tax=Methylobacterium oxalidis TaxID=944322 RepID=A0A512JB22_9HYPH|nr:Bcr/CflA family drug resistance efflux transporter [Methylobacterium oxalidis]GLS66025.1 Bcr/CflA family drug resistance efflux transporter [Methylobacterium oxalidis]
MALLGLLAALPTFGIDMILPSLAATAADLGAPGSEVGLAMSVYLLSLGGAPLLLGPLSDRFGRRPAVVWGCTILIVASAGCMMAQSLPQLLAFRVLQGIGASGPGTAAFTLVRDRFQGKEARAKMSFVVLVINVVPMLAPSVGAALLGIGGWRLIYAAPIAAALVLLLVMRFFDEPTPPDPRSCPGPAEVAGVYRRILRNPLFLGNALCNAAMGGAVFAYITGSSLFFIDALGLSPERYGLIFGASSLSVMGGAYLNSHFGRLGVSAGRTIVLGLAVATFVAAILFISALARSFSPVPVVAAMVGVALSFGLISPNAVHAALQPMPEVAGSASAVAILLQTALAAVSSDLVARLFDGRTALSMAGVMLAFSLAAAGIYSGLSHLSERGALTAPPRSTGQSAERETR